MGFRRSPNSRVALVDEEGDGEVVDFKFSARGDDVPAWRR